MRYTAPNNPESQHARDRLAKSRHGGPLARERALFKPTGYVVTAKGGLFVAYYGANHPMQKIQEKHPNCQIMRVYRKSVKK